MSLQNTLVADAQDADTAFEEIPIMCFNHLLADISSNASRDLTDATSEDPAARKRLAAQIRDACIRVGFFYSRSPLPTSASINHELVKGHGIPPSVPEAAVKSSLPFFDLPEQEKMKYDIHATDNFKGYNAFLSENTDPEGRGDLNEGYNFGWEALEGDESEHSPWSHTGGAMGGANVWPQGGDDMKEFRRGMLTY
jgi:isopenicillin N synthase-like dioxygenase